MIITNPNGGAVITGAHNQHASFTSMGRRTRANRPPPGHSAVGDGRGHGTLRCCQPSELRAALRERCRAALVTASDGNWTTLGNFARRCLGAGSRCWRARRARVVFRCAQLPNAGYLRLTLQSFRQLEQDTRIPFEVVVVDDGSSDDTQAELADAAPLLPGLRWIFRARDELSCRARARNAGARASRGRYLLFVDAGVMVHPRLLTALAQHWSGSGSERDVVVLETLGLFLGRAEGSFDATLEQFAKLNADGFVSTLAKLRNEPPWADPRQAWFDLIRGDLSQLPAPWLLAWSSALGVPRTLFESCTGFDETFITWGAEDCDFALALFRAGARFRALAAPSALHVPHATSAAEIKKLQHRANALRMHAKGATREGEPFLALADPFAANLLALRLDRTPIERLLPHWSAESLSACASLLMDGEHTRALFVAAPTPVLAAQFPNTDWLVPSAPLAATVARARGSGAAVCAVGCHTNEGAQSRALVVLTDVIRLLPAPVQGELFVEAVRVGKRARLVCLEQRPAPPEECALQQALHAWPLCAIDALQAVAAKARILLTELPSGHSALRAFSLSARATD